MVLVPTTLHRVVTCQLQHSHAVLSVAVSCVMRVLCSNGRMSGRLCKILYVQ